jgi:acyl carrier protein
VRDKIIGLIAQVKDDATVASRVDGSSHLIDDVGLDSLQLINLILLVEEEFTVEVDFESFQIYHLRSLDHFTDYVAGLAKA